jgi:hypothetical protein
VAINRTALALALSETLIEAARAAVANINRKARRRPKRAKKAFDCAEMIILSCFCRCGLRARLIRQSTQSRGSSLPSRDSSAISANFIARLIKGCRGGVCAGSFTCEITEHFQRSNEHFSREAAFWVRLPVATGEPNAQAEDQIGR